MRLSAVAALMILTTVLLSACTQQQMAMLDDRGGNYYGRPGSIDPYHQPTMAVATAAPMTFAPAPQYRSTITYEPVTPVATATQAAPVMQNTTILHKVAPLPKVAANTGWHWPVEGKVIEGFGKQANGIANEGISIAAADGTPIHAAAGGEVAYVGTNVRDYGNMVILRHADGTLTSYAHAREILVSKGDHVLPGDVLGYVGHSGSVKTPQLHFAMRQNGVVVDPLSKLPQDLASR